MEIAFGDGGLIPAVVQDRLTGQVRMLAYVNRESLARTIATGLATFFSRSRGAIWQKGETSGNELRVVALYADCDADAILMLVEPVGPTCHTGSPSCFFRRIDEGGTAADEGRDATVFLDELERVIDARKEASAGASYTKHLLDGGAPLLEKKLVEEARELSAAVAGESDDRVTSEAADVLYHVMVALSWRGVSFRDVLAELERRAGTSGHEEKRSRGPARS